MVKQPVQDSDQDGIAGRSGSKRADFVHVGDTSCFDVPPPVGSEAGQCLIGGGSSCADDLARRA
ncbi:hypothetical protein [Stieleria maiorica]|uniref:hypothetical protein n=1 Tax=Stieleria maiorica TaxID=2795974 RepID=UPI0011C829D9|nr:hypothetical protein [Stieleria maiorica]